MTALQYLNEPVTVFISDPNAHACEAAKDDFRKANFKYGSKIADKLGQHTIDFAIIATNSRERAFAVETALAAGARRLILEKVLFTRLEDYDGVSRLLSQYSARAWVNCARRTYSSFAHIKELIGNDDFTYRVEGTGWGMACNVIHHLDECAALAGSTDFSISTNGLEPEPIPSHRSGYLEFLGRLTASFGTRAYFESICHPGKPGDRVVRIEAPRGVVEISQANATMTLITSDETKRLDIDIPYQSQITARHVDSIRSGKEPDLPDFLTSSALHRPMITAFMSHIAKHNPNNQLFECPIT